MTVFKTTLKIVKKYKFIIILYTIILVLFTGFNLKTNEDAINFVAEKPDVLIINNDKEEGLTKELINYIDTNANIIDIEDTEKAINDALFYRDVNYIIYIPDNFRKDFLKGNNPIIKTKSTKDYQASLAELLITRFLKTASIYQKITTNETDLIKYINDTLSNEVKVTVKSKLDTDSLAKATNYFNFLNYSILAGCVYVISLIVFCFKDEHVRKRTIISSTSYKSLNKQLLLSNSIISISLWLFYILISFILLKDVMFTIHGLIYIINSFLFNICSLTIAFLISNILSNKDAINGVVNVIALGSSFLCGAFVPLDYLPSLVLKIAHFLPSYYFIKNNELIKKLEVINIASLASIIKNIGIILIFIILFITITNYISRKKQKIA